MIQKKKPCKWFYSSGIKKKKKQKNKINQSSIRLGLMLSLMIDTPKEI